MFPDKPCLLVIDDNSDTRARLQTALSDDYTVFCLPHGRDVIAQMELAQPSLLIMDLRPPDQAQRADWDAIVVHAGDKDVPIVYMAANLGLPELRERIASILSQGEKK